MIGAIINTKLQFLIIFLSSFSMGSFFLTEGTAIGNFIGSIIGAFIVSILKYLLNRKKNKKQ